MTGQGSLNQPQLLNEYHRRHIRGFQEVNTGPAGVGSIKGAPHTPGPSDQHQRGKEGNSDKHLTTRG